MAAKSEVGAVLKAKIPLLARLCGDKERGLRTDGALEYGTKPLREWYRQVGIDWEQTLPYTPESNGIAERVKRTIKERVRAALSDAKIGDELWGEAVVAAVFVMNRSPRAGQDLTPWEAFTGKRPDVSGLRVWGRKAFALKPPSQQRGFNPKTNVGIMVGYVAGGRGYRVYLPATKRVVERRDVLMDESPGSLEEKKVRWEDEAAGAPGPGGGGCRPATPRPSPGVSPRLHPSSSGTSGTTTETSGIEAAIEAARRMTTMPDEESSEEENVVEARYPERSRAPPERLGDGAAGGGNANTVVEDAAELMPLREDLPPPPKSVKEARIRTDWPHWEKALQVEQGSMVRNKVWRCKKAPKGTRPLQTKVIFEYKFTQEGRLDRYKCRLVALGCRQRPGRDYHETWAPVPAAETTRGLLATAAARGMHAHHVDVKTAYLNA